MGRYGVKIADFFITILMMLFNFNIKYMCNSDKNFENIQLTPSDMETWTNKRSHSDINEKIPLGLGF